MLAPGRRVGMHPQRVAHRSSRTKSLGHQLGGINHKGLLQEHRILAPLISQPARPQTLRALEGLSANATGSVERLACAPPPPIVPAGAAAPRRKEN